MKVLEAQVIITEDMSVPELIRSMDVARSGVQRRAQIEGIDGPVEWVITARIVG